MVGGPTPDATTSRPSTATSALPRQSCDRCHKQKLRCTREQNSAGGICDRCLRRRVPCVYSFGLPKGRPSAYRTVDEATNSSSLGTESESESMNVEPVLAKHPSSWVNSRNPRGSQTENATSAEQPPPSATTANAVADAIPDAEATTDTSKRMNGDDSLIPGLTDPSANTLLGSWPLLDHLTWPDVQFEFEWNSLDSSSSQLDVIASERLTPFGSHAAEGNGPFRDGVTAISTTQSWNPATTEHSSLFGTGTVDGGSDEQHDGSAMGLDENILVIAKLSELNVRLSALCYSARNGGGISPLDAASFESLAAWLSRAPESVASNPQLLLQTLSGSQGLRPTTPVPDMKHKGILHNVFSASHSLLELLDRVQVDHPKSFHTYARSPVSPPSSVLSGHTSGYFTQPKPSAPPTPSAGGQQDHNALQTIGHLVKACETLLLEIYVAFLTALQQDVHASSSGNGTRALEDVRLVLVVQLCSYYIDRQYQAVDMYMAAQASFVFLGMSGPNGQNPYFPGLPRPFDSSPIHDSPDDEVLADLKHQVHQRLACLRQMLRIT